MEEFGERLKKLRVENQMSQDELAAKLGVSAQAVSKWERGKSTPDLAVIVPMAKLLRISTDRLLGNEGFRQDWDARWNQAMLAGDPAGAVKIAEEAQQELPEIRHFRYRQAEAEAQENGGSGGKEAPAVCRGTKAAGHRKRVPGV